MVVLKALKFVESFATWTPVKAHTSVQGHMQAQAANRGKLGLTFFALDSLFEISWAIALTDVSVPKNCAVVCIREGHSRMALCACSRSILLMGLWDALWLKWRLCLENRSKGRVGLGRIDGSEAFGCVTCQSWTPGYLASKTWCSQQGRYSWLGWSKVGRAKFFSLSIVCKGNIYFGNDNTWVGRRLVVKVPEGHCVFGKTRGKIVLKHALAWFAQILQWSLTGCGGQPHRKSHAARKFLRMRATGRGPILAGVWFDSAGLGTPTVTGEQWILGENRIGTSAAQRRNICKPQGQWKKIRTKLLLWKSAPLKGTIEQASFIKIKSDILFHFCVWEKIKKWKHLLRLWSITLK